MHTPCLVCLSLSQNLHYHSQNLHFLHQSSRKSMSFLLFSMYFKFLVLVFLDFVYMLRYGNMVVEYGFVDVLMSLIYGFCWYNVCSTCLHVCSSFLSIVLCFVLCCSYYFHDKMSLRCFCVSLWIPLNTKIVGIIMFL